MVSFTVDASAVIKNLKAQVADYNSRTGILSVYIVIGMNKVYDRVTEGFKKGFNGRMFLNANANYLPTPAPSHVIRNEIDASLNYEKGMMYSLGVVGGVYSFGLGNIPDLDAATDESIMSSIKAVMGETPEARRSYGPRETISLWRVIEFGAAPRVFGPVNKPFLVFYDKMSGSAATAKSVSHPGQSGKHIFLTKGHKIRQQDIGAIISAIKEGIHQSNLAFHGRAIRRIH